MNFKFFIFLFAHLWVFSALGQEHLANTRHIGLPDGISHLNVNCFLQDKNGLMWIGTRYGLNRFDGHHFKVWAGAKDSLANSDIHFLLEDKAGWIWGISTADGYSKKQVTNIGLVHSETGEVRDFAMKFASEATFELADITHFFSTTDRTLYFFAKGILWAYELASGFEELPLPVGVKPLTSEDGQIFWGVGDGAIVRFDAKGKVLGRRLYDSNENPEELLGNDSGVWLLEFDHPLAYFSADEKNQIVTQPEFINNHRKGYFYDQNRDWLWFGDYLNIVAFDASGKKVFDLKQSTGKKFDAHVISIFVDQKGLVWVGTRKGFYLMEIKANRFQRYLYTLAEDNAPTRYQCRDLLAKGENLFVNTYQGSMKVDLESGRAEELDRPRAFTFSKPHFLFHETEGEKIWSVSNHLWEMDGETGAVVSSLEVKGNEHTIWSMHVDREGTAWLGMQEGLALLRNGSVSTFRAYNGFSALEKSQVYVFHETAEGMLWLGTDSGLYLLDILHGVTDRFWPGGKKDHYLPGTQIQHIHEDKDGYFWMATENEGLIKWHPETKEFTHLTRADGLPTNTLYAVYEDEKGFLWLSSDFGLIQMDKQTFRKKIFMPEDGISYPEFNRISHYQSDNGRIYFGGQNGVTAFHPKDFWEDWQENEKRSLQFYQFTEGHDFGARPVEALERLQSGGLLEYSHDVRTLTLKAKAPDFFLADKIDYFYRVETLGNPPFSPFSEEWVKSEGNTINILGMVPGKYRLHIEARGLDGERVGKPGVHDIEMDQPFTHTWLFRGMVLVLTLSGIVSFFLLRSRNLKAQQKQLKKMVEERTRQILADQRTIKEQEARIQQLDYMLNSREEDWLRQVENLVQEKLTSFDLSIADIAEKMNISRTHFFRKIKTVTGLTPNQYLQEARLMEAKRLLESGEYDTVKAVSLSVGFKKSSYFSTLFKKRFGYSPSEYFNQN